MDTNSMMSLAALVRARNAGKANPELMVALCRDAIARKDRRIRAFAHVAEAAPAQAAGPLAGIAIGVKDILDTFDQPTAYGSPVYEGHQPRVDAAIVDLARRKGATIIGKTATTEFAFFSPAATVNPHNPVSHTRRLILRLRSSGRRRHDPRRHRHPDRRLGGAARRFLRDCRLQAELSPAAGHGYEALRPVARHRRPVWGRGRGRRTVRSPSDRPRSCPRRR
jgi:hypothetical protein